MSGAANRAGAGVGGIASDASISRLRSFGSQAQWTGRQLSMGMTAPLVLAGAAAVKWGFDNEAAGMRLKKVYGDVAMSQDQIDRELASLDKNFTALSNTFGMNKESVIEVAGAWAAAGSSGEALAKQTALTAKTMVLGNMTAEESTSSLIAIQAQYGQSTDDLAETIAQLNAIENVAATDLKGLVVGYSRAAGVARDAGIPTRELGAMIAALTPAAGSASEAGNGLKTMISRIMNPTSAATQVIREMGIATDETSWSSLNAAERMKVLSKRYGNLDDAQKAVVASTLASNWQVNRFSVAMRELSDETDGYYKKAMDATADPANVFAVAQKELDVYMKANPTKAKQAAQTIKNALTDAFAPLIPFVVWILQQLANLMRAFTNLSPHVQKMVIAFLAVLAVIGPLIIAMGIFALAVSQLAFLWVGLGKVVRGVLFGPFKLVGSVFMGIAGAAISMAATTAAAFGRIIAVTRLFNLALIVTSGVWYAVQFAAGIAMAGLFLLLQAGMTSLAAMWTARWIIMANIQRAFGALALAIDATRSLGMLAIQSAYNMASTALAGRFYALQVALHRAWMATSTALQVAYNALMLTLSAGYWATFTALQTAMWRAQAIIQGAYNTASIALQVGYNYLSLQLQALWATASASIMRTWATVRLAITMLSNKLILQAFYGFAALWMAAQRIWALATLANLKTVMLTMLALVRGGLMGVVRGVIAAGAAIVGAFSLPWVLAIAAVVGLFVIFKDQIFAAVRNVIDYFRNMPAGLAQALSPIANVFGAIKGAIMSAFNALPESIKNAMRRVVAIIQAAALKIYELFSYINPFARHSPSLVENVTNGMKVVGNRFGDAASTIDGHIKAMYDSMQAFGGAAAGLLAEDKSAKASDARSPIAKVAPDVLASYDDLNSKIATLRGELANADVAVKRQESVVKDLDIAVKNADKGLDMMNDTLSMLRDNAEVWSNALDKAQAKLDNYGSAPIKGMRAMEDQIFANEQAQKRLQLALLDMDASGVESATDSLARMQGAVEDMQGQRNELRMAGAGSDITGFYDSQIDALRAQQEATQKNLGPIEAMNKELERLKLSADRMDLEKSLKFDGLTRQIEQLMDTSKELSFEEITSGIRSSRAEVNAYSSALEMANLMVSGQEAAIKAATAARDGLKDRYDTENDQLTSLNDKYSEIESTIREGETALSDLTSAAEASIQRMEDARNTMLDAIRMGMDPGSSKEAVEAAKNAQELKDAYEQASEAAKKAKEGGATDESVSPNLQNFRDAEGGNWEDVGGLKSITREGDLGDQTAGIDKLTEDMNTELAGMLGGFDMFGPIKEKWNQFKGWWDTNVGSLGTPLKTMFSDIGAGMGAAFSGEGMDKLSTFGQWIQNIGNWLKGAWDTIVGFGGAVGRLFGPDVMETLTRIRDGFVDMYEKIQPKLKELWDTLGPAIVDAAKVIGPVIALIVGAILGVIKILWEMFNNSIKPIFNLIGTVIGAVIDIIKGIVQIIQGVAQVIMGLFQTVVGFFKGIFTGDWSMFSDGIGNLVDGVVNIFNGLLNIVGAILTTIGSLFKNGFLFVVGLVTGFVEGIFNFFKWLWDELVGNSIVPDMINGIITWFQELPGRVLAMVEGFIINVIAFFASLIIRIGDSLGDLGALIGGWVMSAWNWVVNELPGYVSDFFSFIGSIPGKILDRLGNGATMLVDFGKNLIQGLLDGAGSLLSKIGEFFLDKVPGWIKEPFKKALEIQSPSKVFAEYGENTGQGFINGVAAMLPEVAATTQAMANAAADVDLGTIAAPVLEMAQAASSTAEAQAAPVNPTAELAPAMQADTDAARAIWEAFDLYVDAELVSMEAQFAASMTSIGSGWSSGWTALSTDSSAKATAMRTSVAGIMSSMAADELARISALAKQITDLFNQIKDQVTLAMGTARDNVTTAFKSLSDNLNSIFNDGIKPMFDAFTPMLDALEQSFESTVSNVGSIWDGIKEKTAVPARFVINDVYNDGIRGAWNKFNAFLGLPALEEQVARFRVGGPVFGAGTGTSDSVPALLSRGEHVVTASEVRAAGGHAAIIQQRKAWKDSGGTQSKADLIGKYALGGPVDSSLWRAASTAFPNATLNSAMRPGQSGYHGKGQAVDLGGPIQQIANWIFKTYPASAQLIYGPGPVIAEGNTNQDYARYYFRDDLAGHYDHIHWASKVPVDDLGTMVSTDDASGGMAQVVPMWEQVTKGIEESMAAVRNRIPQIDGGIGKWPLASTDLGEKMLKDFLIPKAKEMQNSPVGGGNIGDVESWRPMAMAAMRRNGFNADDKAQVDAMLRQIQSESSGNPTAIQQVIDVNSGGNEAAGLLQIAKGTWPGVRDPSLVDDRLDPWANMNGALRYYKREYGMDLTTVWGKGNGYDDGGVLQPGITQAINASNKPEAILTSTQWDAVYSAANDRMDATMVADGVTQALQDTFGLSVMNNLTEAQASSIAKELEEKNGDWKANVYDVAKEQAAAAELTAKAGEKTASGLDKFVEIGGKIQAGVNDLSKVMLAVATAMQGEQNFSAWAPVISAVGDMIQNMPDQEPTYVPWAGFDVVMTGQMKREKLANDAANSAKGMFNIFKNVAGPMLKHTAAIGTAAEKLITQNAPVVSAAMAMMPTNPVGGAIMLIPVILQSIFTILPMVIAAIMDIVPALIKGIQQYFQKFSPYATFAYDDIAGAEEAVKKNTGSIKDGSYLASMGVKQPGRTIEGPANQNVNINVYGGITMPNVKNGDDAGDFVKNLQILAGE